MEWISPESGLIYSDYEGNIIDDIEIVIDGSSSYIIKLTSGNFPDGVKLKTIGEKTYISGNLPSVIEDTTYSFMLTAYDISGENQVQISRAFAIEVKTKKVKWSENNPSHFDALEKTYFKYQFQLDNPNGDEKFIKIAGSLPNGLTLSESGLLYGVPEEDKDTETTFIVAVYRGDKQLFNPIEMTIKINDLSTVNKPLWITDSGILDYLYYDNYKKISVLAYDYNGSIVFYDLQESNLPPGITFNEETGVFEGTCKTREINKWTFKIIPYIIKNGVRVNGDERTFYIYTNYIKEDDEIYWDTDTLKNAKIGYRYKDSIKAHSSSKITFEIVQGSLPTGLKMNKNGEIFGTVDFQDLQTYTFTVRASNSVTFSQMDFSIEVNKGLSKNSLDTFLYINKENQETYQDLLLNFDTTSSYNNYNDEYRIPSYPKIDIATICTYDPILLKYKFNQFNLPIEIFWKETKKKTFNDYDFFYKDFLERNKVSEEFELKLHTDNETVYINDDGSLERRGYIREPIDVNEIKIVYRKLLPDGEEGDIIEDTENIHQEVNDIKTNYYYIDPETKEEYLIADPRYYYQGEEISHQEYIDIQDYVKYGKTYCLINNVKTYIEPVYEGMYYEKESKKMIPSTSDIYVKMNDLPTGDTEIIKYILNENGEEIRIETILEDSYASYSPFDSKEPHYLLKKSDYEIIYKEENENNYYKFNSPTIPYKNASIKGLRDVLSESFNVDIFDNSDDESVKEEYKNKLWYKIGNQEFVYKKNGKLQDFDFHHYILHYDEKKDRYWVEYEGSIVYLYVWRKISDDDYRQVFADYNGKMLPVIQKSNILDGNVNYKFYCVYQIGKTNPFVNALFECDWDDDLKLTCEYNEETGVYEWFRIKQVEHPYVYYAEHNQEYGFDKDIVLPYITEENIIDGKVTFLDLESEKDLLPDYMEETVDDQKVKIYTPTLPLFYGIPNSHNTRLKVLNNKEKEGEYWYDRKFVFFELHFSPKFEKNIDNFTIPFYNDVNNNSPEFLLI